MDNKMNDTKLLTKVYLDSYMYALEETKNPNLAAGAATGVTMIVSNNLQQKAGSGDIMGMVLAEIIKNNARMSKKSEKREKREDGEKDE